MKRIIVITLVVVLVLASQLLSQQWQGRAMMGDAPGLCARLNLTTEQLNTLKEMRLEFQKEMLPLRNEMQANRLELQSLIISSKPDQGKIDAVIDEIGKLRTQAQKKRVAHRLDMREQLTDEQKAIWDAMPKGLMMRGMRKGCIGFGGNFGRREMYKRGVNPRGGGWW